MATQRQVRAKNAQLMHVWTALNIAGSYGKVDLARQLETLAEQIAADELTWNAEWQKDQLEALAADEDENAEVTAEAPSANTIMLTIGWSHPSKLGSLTEVAYRVGHPIKVEGLDLDLVIEGGHIEIRGTGDGTPVIRATSANSIQVRPEPFADWPGSR